MIGTVAVQLRKLDARGRWALCILGLLSAVALLAPVLSPHPPAAQLDIVELKSRPPSLAHPFGTDSFSRDVLTRVMYGARVSLSVATLAVLVATVIGTFYGLAAAMSGSAVDAVLMRLLDAFLSIPRLLFLIALLTLWNPVSLAGLVLMLGFTGWFDVARLVRADALSVREREFVLAARSLGAGRARLVLRHVLPNVAAPVIVSATLGVANVLALEAALSFLGIGAREPDASWGTMFHEGTAVFSAMWWLALFPGLAMVITVVSFNLLGDSLRAILDPRQLASVAPGTLGAAVPATTTPSPAHPAR